MNEEILEFKTVPGFPLGQPKDGRPRYGMTPEQARLYRWLLKSRPHHIPFPMHFRDAEVDIGIGKASLHRCMQGLVERGWVDHAPNGGHAEYRMVRPVKRFRSVPAADAAQ